MEPTYCPVCGYDLELEDRDQMVDACPCCRFGFERFTTKMPYSYFDSSDPSDLFVRIWRGMWKESHLPWRGDEQTKPTDWDPIKQMHRIGIHLADTFPEWMEDHPVIIPENKEKFLQIALRKIEDLGWKPDVIEALWDGDTQGWFLLLLVSTEESGNQGWAGKKSIISLRGSGGDIRVFNRQVPPWPEAIVAQFVGEQIAKQLGIPFYFPSPEQPNDDYAGWWERNEQYRCRSCERYLRDDLIESVEGKRTDKLIDICWLCEREQEQK